MINRNLCIVLLLACFLAVVQAKNAELASFGAFVYEFCLTSTNVE